MVPVWQWPTREIKTDLEISASSERGDTTKKITWPHSSASAVFMVFSGPERIPRFRFSEFSRFALR